ncbi:NAD(P)-binding domain-containing protein [Candidatus Berkelbacteria bacterium]|nr:NAD(P)-binding domain-containing protein [Candidatus Berkelbacteria bacterium]
MNIAIIGAGALGAALAKVLTDAGQRFAQWDVATEKLPKQITTQEAVGGAEIVLLCIPTNSTRAAAEVILPHLPQDAIVVSLSKGMEAETGKLIDELLDEVFPDHETALLSGPMLAAELSAGKLGAATVAADDRETSQRVIESLNGTALILESSTDRRGVALCGVLKNIYAIGLGIAHSLDWGENANGWLIAHVLGEMEAIATELGGQRETIFSVAGIGDFVATALSETSRNHQYGFALARGETPSYVSEGAIALPKLLDRLGASVNQPFLQAIRNVVIDHDDPVQVFTTLRRR